MTNILSKNIYVGDLPSNEKMEGTVMVSKDFLLNLADSSNDISAFKKDLLKSMDELSLVFRAAHCCRDIDELKQFLKF